MRGCLLNRDNVYYMPGMTGEEVVLKLRQVNPIVQIILQTGYSGEQPARELIYRLDIQGYHDKSERREKLLRLVDTSLKRALKQSAELEKEQPLLYTHLAP